MTLNNKQLEAVKFGDGPLLVLAGAGSGKTRVLTYRIAYLIQEKGIRPDEILAVTFTNKAAQEMKDRVQRLVGADPRSLWISTFHSISLRILRRHANFLGFSNDFNIYDDGDQTSLVKECLRELNLDEKKITPASVVNHISRAKDSLLDPDAYLAKQDHFYGQKVAQVYKLYEEKLKTNQAMDFGDLIYNAVRLFEKNPDALARYQKQFKYILVDEYQDTNHAQYKLISILSKVCRNVFAVGDPDQSIYGWRGADINNILNYERDFSDSTLIKLEQNYRSTKTILSASNAIIVRNKSRKDKELWTENGDGEKISYVSSMTGKDEARFVADEIVRLRGQGYSYRNIAIFYRTNAQSRAFEDVFTGINIPYVIYGGLRFYERMEVKDILAYLKFLTSPHDSVSLKRIINKPVRGIGNTTISKLESVASQYNISLYSAIEESAKQRIFNFGTIKKLESFVKLVCELRNLLGTETLPSIIKAVIDKSGYVSNLKLQNSHEAQDRIDNLNELIASGEEFAKGLGEEKDQLRTFLDQVSLVSGIDGFDPSLGQIPMMTLHLAKGLEFPIVFMVGMEEGLFPHSRSMDNEDELEEERRLCYVGMTRAMEKLYMCNAWRRAVYGSEQCNLPSRFIDDIPSEYIVRKNMMPKVKPLFRPEIGKSASVDFDFDQRSDCEKHGEYFIGRKVKHQKFGVGTIKRHEESHEGPKVTVYFQSGNVKKLLVKYANLELL